MFPLLPLPNNEKPQLIDDFGIVVLIDKSSETDSFIGKIREKEGIF